MIRSALLLLASLAALAGCAAPGGQSAPRYPYGFTPAPYAGAPAMAAGTGAAALPAPLARVVAENPSNAQIEAQLKGKDFLALTPDDIAALSVMATRDICNVPDGTPITADAPCLAAR
ncbi:MAG: hypothetical protein R3D78_04550 [Paracoccaceae bacterium]|jgi:hypothetical protein